MSVRIAHLLLCLGLLAVVSGCKKKPEETSPQEKSRALVFELDEVSAFSISEKAFTRGQLCQCNEEPETDVKVYPPFKSDKPFYGSVRFAGEYRKEDSGIQYHFAVDESAGTGKGYDQLYFDLNGDLDLTNDPPLQPLKNRPDEASLNYSYLKQQVWFDYLKVNFDFGSTGQRPFEIMPCLTISDSGYTSLIFVSTKAYKGEVEIAGQKYNVVLGHNYLISGWFDRPWTALHLIPKGAGDYPQWWGGDRLMAIHKIGGTYYRFSATPGGDKLIVQSYDGDLGTLEVGAGGRDIQEMAVHGSLRSKDAAVAVGGEIEHGFPKEARICKLPVGDYLATLLTISFGRLSISISENYHSDGKPRDRAGRPYIYGIKIRKDKPYILDFANKPEVMFASPPKDTRLRLGEELTVKAILTDPEVDIMIRDLKDATRRQREIGPDGKPGPYETNVSLDPKVAIMRADGEKVADGVMPFG